MQKNLQIFSIQPSNRTSYLSCSIKMKTLHRLVLLGVLVATVTQTGAAAAQVTCADGSAPGNRITFARKNDKTCSGEKSMKCDSTGGADQPQGFGAIKVDGSSKTYIASSLTITEGMVFYIGTEGIEAEPMPQASTWFVDARSTSGLIAFRSSNLRCPPTPLPLAHTRLWISSILANLSPLSSPSYFSFRR